MPQWYLQLCRRVLRLTEDRLAVGLTFKLLATPLYQDNSVVGIVIGPIIRSLKLLLGMSILFPLFLVIMIPLIFWIIFEGLIFFIPQYPQFTTPFLLINLGGIFVYVLVFFRYNFRPLRQTDNLYFWSHWDVRGIIEKDQTVGQIFVKFWQVGKTHKILVRLGVTEEMVNDLSPKLLTHISGFQILNNGFDSAHPKMISITDTLQSLFSLDEPLLDYFEKRGIAVPEIRSVIWWNNQEDLLKSPPTILSEAYQVHTRGGVNRSWSALPTPFLNSVSHDLTKEVQIKISPFIIPRDKILMEIERSLGRSKSNHVLLVGPSGSGKTSLLYSLASKIITGGDDRVLWDQRVVVLYPSELTSGAKNAGEIELRFNNLMDEVSRAGNIILAIEDIHTLLSPGETAELNPVLKILVTHLNNARFKLIATTTPEAFREYLEGDPNLIKNFDRIDLEEASLEEVLPMLELKALEYEGKFEGLTFTYLALKKLLELSNRLIHDRVMPDKAFNSLDTVINSLPRKSGLISPELVIKVISEEVHIPLGTTAEEKKGLLHLEKTMEKRVIGQKAAIHEIASILRRARVGVANQNRPIGSILLAGPTGVGKTEIARTLSSVYFGNEEMIRLDMSEYQGVDGVKRLIGGMDGKDEQFGILSEAVKSKPGALILLDELEKADPGVLDIFLQILEDGTATDGSGQKIDFTNNLIYATSNVGSEQIIAALNQGLTVASIKKQLDELMFHAFKPEFLNRFDGIVYANALSLPEVEQIANLQLRDLAIRVKHEQGIILRWTPQFVTGIAQLGFTPTLGARPLRRVIQDRVESSLATMILKGLVKPGGTVLLTPQLLVNQS